MTGHHGPNSGSDCFEFFSVGAGLKSNGLAAYRLSLFASVALAAMKGFRPRHRPDVQLIQCGDSPAQCAWHPNDAYRFPCGRWLASTSNLVERSLNKLKHLPVSATQYEMSSAMEQARGIGGDGWITRYLPAHCANSA